MRTKHTQRYRRAATAVALALAFLPARVARAEAPATPPTTGDAPTGEQPAAPAPTAGELCSAAYERTQVFERGGALTQAREQTLLCAKRDCPDFVQKQCVEWLADLDVLVTFS